MSDISVLEHAMHFSIDAHKGMVRKASRVPYILHPMEAAAIVSTITTDCDVLAAAVLHDVVEDTDMKIEEVEKEFGKRIAYLVAGETENKREGIPPDQTWKIRKAESLDYLRSCNDRDVKILWLGDKLSNMRSFYRLHLQLGNDLWKMFHQSDPVEQEWYYRGVADAIADLKEHAAWQEYVALTDIVFSKEE